MGYRLKYPNAKVVKYTIRGKKKWGISEGNILISAVRGLTKSEAQKQLKYYKKVKTRER